MGKKYGKHPIEHFAIATLPAGSNECYVSRAMHIILVEVKANTYFFHSFFSLLRTTKIIE